MGVVVYPEAELPSRHGLSNSNTPTEGGFWSNEPSNPTVWRLRDRLFVGDAVGMPDGRVNTNDTFLSDTATGANWIPRDSQFCSMQTRGGLAVSGASRSSDGDGWVGGVACIGVAGAVLNDSTISTQGAWAFYADVQHEAGAYANSYGIEIAVKNKAANQIPDPYSSWAGAYGVWLSGGSDDSYGGSPANPSAAAIAILENSTTWNKGIIFRNGALTDLGSGLKTAIEMPVNNRVRWISASGVLSGQIYASGTTSGKGISQVFEDDYFALYGASGKRMFGAQHVANAVNYPYTLAAVAGAGVNFSAAGDDTDIPLYIQPKGASGAVILNASGSILAAQSSGSSSSRPNYWSVANAAAGSAPTISVVGTDTDIDLRFTTKGTGVLRFGTHSALAAETVTGYITIKDSGGTTRKLAVVS